VEKAMTDIKLINIDWKRADHSSNHSGPTSLIVKKTNGNGLLVMTTTPRPLAGFGGKRSPRLPKNREFR